ncbi:hypothetical protein ACFFQW_35195 [Umezawaea endophytica]|uniref:Uncharacterized protein n=1 Tax=Umezawaea endophytica TaxID=1654476 RepID=A0A9X2VX22_9PSEU|nr:hypothetical protein [Umezawaea endophytica]MCS7483712.1 hypothetical protein [Umezawaea endophytica]
MGYPGLDEFGQHRVECAYGEGQVAFACEKMDPGSENGVGQSFAVDEGDESVFAAAPDAGSTAFREPTTSSSVESDVSTLYCIEASVNAANGTGSVGSIEFVCEIAHDDSIGRWDLRRLQVDDRMVFPES